MTTTTLPQPTRGAGWFSRTTRPQRRLLREIAAVLDADLYKRIGGAGSEQRPDDPCFATWVSPLKWIVDYGRNDDGETMWARCYGPDGKVFGSCMEIDCVEAFETVIP